MSPQSSHQSVGLPRAEFQGPDHGDQEDGGGHVPEHSHPGKRPTANGERPVTPPP